MNSGNRGPFDGPNSARPYPGNDTRAHEFPPVTLAPFELVPYEGGPWNGNDSLVAFQEHMLRTVSRAFFIPLELLYSSKTCLSCGAKTDPYGNLPCGH
jgi:hypothetical protein